MIRLYVPLVHVLPILLYFPLIYLDKVSPKIYLNIRTHYMLFNLFQIQLLFNCFKLSDLLNPFFSSDHVSSATCAIRKRLFCLFNCVLIMTKQDLCHKFTAC